MKIGQEYWCVDADGSRCRIVIIGYDPIEQKWVAASKYWAMGISHIDENDSLTPINC